MNDLRLVVAACWVLAAAPALADSVAATEILLVPPVPATNGYWSAGEPRWFVSTRSEVGTIYAKPYFSAGYGVPHWLWAGVDLNAITTLELGQFAGGLRLATPIIDLTFSARDTWSYDKPFLTPAQTFTRSSVLNASGPSARFTALEGEATIVVPLPHAALVANFIVVDILDAPPGKYIYAENYRAVVKNPLFLVVRALPLVRLLNESSLKIGLLSEYVFHTGRSQGVLRMGPVGALQLTNHVQIMAGVSLALSSPDRLGLALGAFGLAGIRYQWATGEARPELPWKGDIIP